MSGGVNSNGWMDVYVHYITTFRRRKLLMYLDGWVRLTDAWESAKIQYITKVRRRTWSNQVSQERCQIPIYTSLDRVRME